LNPGIGESILHSHSKGVLPPIGEAINVKVDLMLCDDYTMSRAHEFFEKMNGNIPIDKDKIVVTCEHFTPPSTIESASLQQDVRTISRKWKLKHFYELGRSGTGPLVAISNGLVKPGMMIVGTSPIVTSLGGLGCYATSIGPSDMAALWRKGEIHLILPKSVNIKISGKKQSHIDGIDIALFTLKNLAEIDEYHMLNFYGDGAMNLALDDRLELAFFMAQKGANTVLIPPSKDLFSLMNIKPENTIAHEIDAQLNFDLSFDVAHVEPMVAVLVESEEIIPIKEAKAVEIDAIIIGGGLAGTLGNLRILDRMISGKQVNSRLRMFVYPGSSEIFLRALEEGIIERLSKAGAMICTPGRGAEGYGYRGIISKDEKVMTNSALFQEGIFGLMESEIYFAGTLTCAASAIAGKIVHPLEVQ